MKINPFRRRRRCPRNKRDRNSGNSALRSREADEARWRRTNPNATRLDGDVGRSISGPTRARGSSWTARRNRRSAPRPPMLHRFVNTAASSSVYNTSFSGQRIHCIAQSGAKREFIMFQGWFLERTSTSGSTVANNAHANTTDWQWERTFVRKPSWNDYNYAALLFIYLLMRLM